MNEGKLNTQTHKHKKKSTKEDEKEIPAFFLLFPVCIHSFFFCDFYSDKCGFLTKDEKNKQHKYYRSYTYIQTYIHIRIEFSGIQTLFTGI